MMKQLLVFMLTGYLAAPVSAGDGPLFDFESPGQMEAVGNRDSQTRIVELNGSHALRVETGTDVPYPNVTLEPAGGAWDLSRFERLEADITNLGEASLKIGCRVDNAGATGRKNSNTGGITLKPGETGTLAVHFNRKFAQELRAQLKGMDYTPWGERGHMIDPSRVVSLNFFMNKPTRPHVFAIDNVRGAGDFDPASLTIPEPFFPFVDRFGQYIHRDWPGKVKSQADLVEAREAEAAAMDSMPRPDAWDRYGGWADGPQLEATGHFRTEKYEDMWYLVDPDGQLFFSLGMDVVQARGASPIDHRDGWFANAPWEHEPELADHLGVARPVRRGEYKGQTPRTFSFYTANLERKYGEDWRAQWMELIPRRLMNWGFNTIGNWSDPELLGNVQIPYTHWVYYNTAKLPWQRGTRNRIPDPFHPTFEPALRRRALRMTKGTTDDPYCIGYFVDNELSWGDETYLAEGVVQGDADQPAKQQMIEFLKGKYGTIEKLNTAWQTGHASWDALLHAKEVPVSPEGRADLVAFNERIVRKYFETVRRVMKDVAPDKLYLGCRFAESNPQVVRIAAEYCDVVSFNLYRGSLAGWAPPADIDKPIIIGEFHFGATDRGVFGPGLVRADSAADRARKFRRYVLSAASNPLIVGAHWFQLLDESLTGRPSDGENHGIGFLDVTDTPYPEMIEASRDVAARLYPTRHAAASE